jgi:hypothetical protein
MAKAVATADDEVFALRLDRSADDLWGMTDRLYGTHRDYPAFGRTLQKAMRAAWADRPAALKRLDLQRDLEPDWFLRPGMGFVVALVLRFQGFDYLFSSVLLISLASALPSLLFPPMGTKPLIPRFSRACFNALLYFPRVSLAFLLRALLTILPFFSTNFCFELSSIFAFCSCRFLLRERCVFLLFAGPLSVLFLFAMFYGYR